MRFNFVCNMIGEAMERKRGREKEGKRERERERERVRVVREQKNN